MIPKAVYNRLRANWGPRSEAMACFAEIKFIDHSSGWAWYILAVNPEDDNTINCIMDEGGNVNICTLTLSELELFYDCNGNAPEIDTEYRRIKADVLYRKLGGK